MNTKGFSDEQKAALTDLLVLGMYQDRHLASAENEQVKRLLASFEFPSDYAQQQFVDAAFARVNKHPQTEEAIRSSVFECAAKFETEAHRRKAFGTLAELLASDNNVTGDENRFIAIVREGLNLKN